MIVDASIKLELNWIFFFSFYVFSECFCLAVGLVNSSRYNLTSKGGYLVLPLELTFLKDREFVKFLIQSVIITVFIFFVLHHLR